MNWHKSSVPAQECCKRSITCICEDSQEGEASTGMYTGFPTLCLRPSGTHLGLAEFGGHVGLGRVLGEQREGGTSGASHGGQQWCI